MLWAMVEPRATLALAAAGTTLALVAFTGPLATINAIGSDLHAGVAGTTWILSSISIGLGAALLTAGTIADGYGRRRTFQVGLALMALGSAASAVATGVGLFVAARVVQGIGAAAVIAASLGLIAQAYPPGPGRTKASGVWGAGVGAGIAIGPLVTALFDRAHTWRDMYWLLALVCAALAVWTPRLAAESRTPQRRGLDWIGAGLFGAGISALLAGLVEGRSGWTHPEVVALFAATAASLTLFVVREKRAAAPMFDLALVRQPSFVAATVAAFATGCGVIGQFSFLSGFLGAVVGIGAFAAAVMLLAWSVTSMATALLVRRIPDRISPRIQLAGAMMVVAIGQLALARLHAGATWRGIVPALFLAGLASGVVNANLGREAVASVPPERSAMGSGANNTARYVGAAIGVTIMAVIVTSPAHSLGRGWTIASLVTAGFTLLGAAIVLTCRPRQGRLALGHGPGGAAATASSVTRVSYNRNPRA